MYFYLDIINRLSSHQGMAAGEDQRRGDAHADPPSQAAIYIYIYVCIYVCIYIYIHIVMYVCIYQ